ncbi:MAG: hypothetical protein AAYR31_00575 [Candidatus Vidania fulgoroideorum]
MGKKIDANCHRLIINNNWKNKWYGNFNKKIEITNYIENKLKIEKYYKKSKIKIIKNTNIIITIYCYNNKKHINKLKKIRKEIQKKTKMNVYIETKKFNFIENDFNYIFFNIEKKITKRENYKKFIRNTFLLIEKKINGIKIEISGRINSVDISKKEKYTKGKLSLNTYNNLIIFRKKYIDTKYGIIGIKIWICYEEKKKIQ